MKKTPISKIRKSPSVNFIVEPSNTGLTVWIEWWMGIEKKNISAPLLYFILEQKDPHLYSLKSNLEDVLRPRVGAESQGRGVWQGT
jgi:hypothetical protein